MFTIHIFLIFILFLKHAAKNLKENKAPKGKIGNGNGPPVGNKSQQALTESSSISPRLLPITSDASSTSNGGKSAGAGSVQGGAAAARANREARKKQQKAARENRRESSDQDAGLRNVKQALQVTMAKMTSLFESVVTATASAAATSSSLLVSSVKMVSSTGCSSSSQNRNQPNTVNTCSPGLHIDCEILPRSPSSTTQPSSTTNSNKDSSNANMNGGGNKSRAKKSNDIIKHSSTTGKKFSFSLFHIHVSELQVFIELFYESFDFKILH